MPCETICGVYKALKLFLINSPFLLLHSLTKLLPCRSLDMFHKESKCPKQRGPSINLKFRSKTLQLEKQRECHVLLVPFIFCINEHQSGGARIYNLANGGKERKGRSRLARHTVYLITLQQNQKEPGADYSSWQNCTLEKLLMITITLKKKKRKEKKQQQQQSTTRLHNRHQKGKRIGKKGKREGDWGERTFLPPLPFLRLSRSLWLGLKSFNKHWQPSLLVSSLKFSFFSENLWKKVRSKFRFFKTVSSLLKAFRSALASLDFEMLWKRGI